MSAFLLLSSDKFGYSNTLMKIRGSVGDSLPVENFPTELLGTVYTLDVLQNEGGIPTQQQQQQQHLVVMATVVATVIYCHQGSKPTPHFVTMTIIMTIMMVHDTAKI